MASPHFLLQNAASLAMDALLGRLDLDRGARPYFWVDFRREPPEASHSSWDHCDIAGRFVDALALARLITGRTDAPDAEAALRRFLFAQQDSADGLFYNPGSDAPNGEATKYIPDAADRAGGRYVDLFAQRAPLLAIATLLALDDGDMAARGRRMAAGLRAIAEPDGDMLTFPTYRWAPALRPEWYAGENVPERWLGYRYALLTGLARFVELTGDSVATHLAMGLARFYLRHGEVRPDGSFAANTHSGGVLPTAVGIARLGVHLGDGEMVDWAHRVYAFVREQTPDFGFLRDGLGLNGPFAKTCETCGLADLIHLAIVLTEAGAGDYWDDVERYGRNQLLANQYADADALRRAFPGIAADVLRMLHGGFECAAQPNDLLHYDGAEACCIGGGLRALYLLWRASVADTDGTTHVRMGFTRSTRDVDVIAHEPWEGRIDVHIRSRRDLSVRVPGYAEMGAVRTTVDGADARVGCRHRDVVIRGLAPGQVVSVQYPVPEHTRRYTIGGGDYEADWRGHTVVDMRPQGTWYPMYQRRSLLSAAPGLVPFPPTEGAPTPDAW